MDSPKRVLWLTKGLGRGGAERLLSTSVRYLDKNRFAVDVAYLLPEKSALVPEISAQGVDVHLIGGSVRNPVFAKRLRDLVRSRRYDLIHTHSPVSAAVARTLFPAGPRFVHTEHNVWQRYRHPTRIANAATFGRNSAVIAVSQGVADSIVRPRWALGVRMPPVEVVYHGIDEAAVETGPEAKRRARELLDLSLDSYTVGTVANFTPKKDQPTLLRAFALLAVQMPNARLVLIGSGPSELALRDLARELGVGDRVIFTGSRDDVQHLLPAFDIFVLSSLHEGLSIALVEAMATGLPCVATRVGGVPEAMTDGEEGFLVPVRNIEAFSAAMQRLANDVPLRERMGQTAAQNAQRFSISRAVARIEDTYDRALAEKS